MLQMSRGVLFSKQTIFLQLRVRDIDCSTMTSFSVNAARGVCHMSCWGEKMRHVVI